MNTNEHELENEQHRAVCDECRTLWAELDAISAEAAALPQLTPSRDLWTGIEARIAHTARPKMWQSQTFRLAIAATLLVAVSSGVTWRLATAPAVDALPTLATTSPNSDETPEQAEAAELHLASFTASVTQMEREISALQTIVTERRSELDPRTVEVLEANLKVIDAAIAESRAALDADPASRFLSAQYTRAYTSKITLLRDAARIPTGI